MRFVAYIFILVGLTFSSLFALNIDQSAQTQPSYDSIPITPKTWQEVDLSYSDIIKGKEYPAEIKLLRPISWLKVHGMDKVGNKEMSIIKLKGFGCYSLMISRSCSVKPFNLLADTY